MQWSAPLPAPPTPRPNPGGPIIDPDPVPPNPDPDGPSPLDRANRTRLVSRESGSAVVLTLAGDLDLSTTVELQGELTRRIETGARRIVVDLTAATFIDSTTLGVLLSALKRLRPVRGELTVVCPDPNIRRIFQLTLLDRVFSIVETPERARPS